MWSLGLVENESDPQIFHAWSPVNELTGRIRRCVLAGGLSVGVGFDISKTHARPNVTLSLPTACESTWISQLLLESVPACVPPYSCHVGHGLTSETVRKPSYMLPL